MVKTSATRADSTAWRVDTSCRRCTAAWSVAPGLIGEGPDGRARFVRQPANPDEAMDAWRALYACPANAIHAPQGMTPPAGIYPHELAEGAYRVGFNDPQAAGAQSYFIRTRSGLNLLIDGPRYMPSPAAFFERQGGLDHILLTHRDDVGGAGRYAERFGARTWIHEHDRHAAPWASDILRGDEATAPIEGVRVIPLPGHSRGSVAYLVDRTYLLTGDSLYWDHRADRLEAFPDFCWYDWDIQLRSLAKLRSEHFSWVLAGHGGSVALAPERVQAELAAMLHRWGAA